LTFIIEVINRFINRSREERGQTLVEYGLIIALISVVAVVGMQAIGTNVLAVFNDIAADLVAAVSSGRPLFSPARFFHLRESPRPRALARA